MIYYLAMCPKCGEIQSNQTEKAISKATFHCRKCRKSTRIFNKMNGYFRVNVIKMSENPLFLSKFAQIYKENIQNDPIAHEKKERALFEHL
jgi:transcription elongation factor Elf1